MRTTAMIMAILIAAYFLNFVITSIGLTGQVNSFITGLGLTSTQLLVAVIVFYLILGMFMETLSMMVATVPIIAPIMFKAGYDPIWFGVLIVVLMETAMITPPVGINLYVVQGLRTRGQDRRRHHRRGAVRRDDDRDDRGALDLAGARALAAAAGRIARVETAAPVLGDPE